VKVFNLDNGRSAVLKIADRGPFIRGRIIDVSPAAASTLGFRDNTGACADRAALTSPPARTIGGGGALSNRPSKVTLLPPFPGDVRLM